MYGRWKNFIFLFLSFSILIGKSWLNKARIAGADFWYDMPLEKIFRRIDAHAREGVSVLLIWARISNHYQLKEKDRIFLRKVSEYIHSRHPNMKVLLYIAPLEMVTYDADMDRDGRPDPGKSTLYRDHPEWIQVGIDGRLAVFYGALAFWLSPTSEDAWLCPNDPVYRSIWFNNFIELAKTGIDGVWWDVPFFLHSFGENWQQQWSCHCEDCQEGFRRFSGKKIPDREDWSSPVWRQFINWRLFSMLDFIKKCRSLAQGIKPDFVLINESWDPSSSFETEVAFSPHLCRIYNCNDGVAHEFNPLEPSEYFYYSWLLDVAQGIIYRGVDQTRPSWVLSYSHTPQHAITRAATLLFTGCNFYETGYPDMASTVSFKLRRHLFNWIKDHEDLYYNRRLKPFTQTAVVRSLPSYKYFGLASVPHHYELLGVSMMLLESHVPFEILPSELLEKRIGEFRVVIFPSVSIISDSSLKAVREFIREGGKVIITGEFGGFYENGRKRKVSGLRDVCGVESFEGIRKHGKGLCIVTKIAPGSSYYEAASPTSEKNSDPQLAEEWRTFFYNKLWLPAVEKPMIITNAEKTVLFNPLRSTREFILRVVNLTGLKKNVFEPVPVKGLYVKIRRPLTLFFSKGEEIEFLKGKRDLNWVEEGEYISFRFDIKRHKIIKLSGGAWY